MCVRKFYLWILKMIMKVTVCELIWSVSLIVFVSYLLFRHPRIADNQEICNIHIPSILWWTEGFHGTLGTITCPDNNKCEVYSSSSKNSSVNIQAYIFYGSNLNFSDLPQRNPEKTVWGLYHEESPRNIEALMHEPVLSLFNFSSTYSRYSDVPFPLQYLESRNDITSTKYFVETPMKNLYLKDIAPVLYIQSDCETSTERDLYVEELMKLIQVDSYGGCLNNKKLPEKFTVDYLNNLNEDEFLTFVARYKFVVAIENGVCEDYVTEKFWRAIKVGSVPIYFGSPSIKDWFPNKKSAILLEDYPTPELMTKNLNELLENDDLYDLYLEHKINQRISNKRIMEEFEKRTYQFDSLLTVDKFQCYICEMLHKKSKGNIVNKRHYNCPKPMSALTLGENPENSWVHSWDYNKDVAEDILKKITNRE